MSAKPNHSIPEIVRELSSDLSNLVRSEVTLAKAELQENISRLGTGAGLLGGAGIAGLFAAEFVLLAIMFGLVRAGVPAWLSALIVAVALGIVAGVLAMRGKKNVSGASLAPARTIEHVRTDLRVIKDDVDQLRRQ
jgi:uncharacterized membrane protein YqjE